MQGRCGSWTDPAGLYHQLKASHEFSFGAHHDVTWSLGHTPEPGLTTSNRGPENSVPLLELIKITHLTISRALSSALLWAKTASLLFFCHVGLHKSSQCVHSCLG